ncbi:nuclear transport factor 2 family protein [Novosphingobium sp.]|uniref:nuclear transport factor 2 family protein n=1 Tax=Novosphingobium sp. TaxID=1874826 RepID=UPI0026126890|nr:nuclear transport factor 2 family protein [Novosphingobium sp.]
MGLTIDELSAREEIRDLLHRYCKGIDRRDWPLVRSCFADDHVHKHASIEGSADDFVRMASAVLSTIPATHHTVGNVHFAFAEDGLSAETEANFVAYHLIEAGHPEGTPVPTGGKATDWIVAGRYCDRFEKRDGKWIIVRRQAYHDWERVDPANV